MSCKVEYNYKDILLQPQHSVLSSRSEANTSIEFGKHTFRLPVVPANMKTVVDTELVQWLAKSGYFYVMHRFDVDIVEFCNIMISNELFTSISVGVNTDSYNDLNLLKANNINPDYITVDIAHGACEKMQSMIEYINALFPETFLIVGNVCTAETAEELCKLNISALKVGIGPGSVCTTKLKTGFSRPQFSAVLECSKVCDIHSVFCLADGGIEQNGDIAKALVAGADMVMAGGMFAGYDESAGTSITQMEHGQEVHYKQFYGSASEHSKNEKKNVEGRRILIPLRGCIVDKFTEITEDLQSSISYAGGNDLSTFPSTEWVVIH